MHIKKLAHCCLVIDLKKVRILLDPGYFSVEKHQAVKNVDIVLITHEHQDHFHIESLKELVKREREVVVITNDAVGEMLAKEGIKHRVMKQGDAVLVKDIHIEAHGEKHAVIYRTIPQVSNIGYYIENPSRPAGFFYPGDALTDPKKTIDVLALPVAGPWIKLSESIDYALSLTPRLAFPVHDAQRIPSQHLIPEKVLSANGIEFIKLEEGGEIEV
ncbi:MAG: hypothetical protein QOG91_106 [Candidatus Parcubacteria bacterium]|jgi:L-ascorbate metabolism protein UlaG (beta-lactamase superfamily)|nr:hypothetical protein [Candidatus Parcubacteria bacterium]